MSKPPKARAEILASTTKPALILVHGFRGSPLGLEGIATELRNAGYQVYLPAIPPFAGASNLETYTPQEYAQFLANYIRQHNLDRPILIGHSMGSVIVSATAHYYPELIHSKIVLLSPISAKPARFFRDLVPLTNVIPNPVIDYISTRYLFIPHNHTLFKDTLKRTRHCSKDQPPKRKALNAAAKFSTRFSVADFNPNQKVLIIAGEHDRLVRKKDTEKLSQRLQAKTIFIPKAGHLHNYEQPQATAWHILDFIKN